MANIKVLPPELRNKISAGEVIERPASVVKELLENSIDAGSTDIKVEVSYGGKRLIRVSDDGCGMDREDALLCFQRHATSKLAVEEDLFDIRTLGFRGEALPSIASVSRVKLVTGVRGSPLGVSMELEGGTVKETRDSAFSGTLVEISDIFFNTPARRKFLKTNSTELSHIIDAVAKEAIAHYEVSFSLFTENRETMVIPRASGFRERIMQVFGAEFLEGLAEVHASEGEMQLAAFLSKSTAFRKSRSHQYTFVNRRPVKDQTVSAALYRAYEGILPSDKHPAFFLFLEMNPGEVDFNVHPTKREVRFQDKEGVYRFIHSHARDAVKAERAGYARPFSEAETSGSSPVTPGQQTTLTASPQNSFVAETAVLPYKPSIPFIYLGETFVALSGKGGMTVLDHHAAHERILYEKFLKKMDLGAHVLLFPIQVRLSANEYKALLENRQLLLEFGIEIDDFGIGTVIVRSLPAPLDGSDIRGILADSASAIMDGIAPGKSLRESVAARLACHSSVRGRAVLTQEELSHLLSDLDKTDCPDQCPHGRPTRIFFSFDDLKRLFKRK